MLTADLVRWKREKDQVKVRPIDEKARPRLLEVAEGLIQAAEISVGETREAFQDACGAVHVGHADQRVAAGLIKLLTDRCTFEIDVGRDPVELRTEVFTRATVARRALAPGERFDRQAVLAEAGAALDIAPTTLEAALFADLKEAHVLVAFEPLTPAGLLHIYDREQERAALLMAVRVVVEIEETDPGIWRNLFRSLKFHRLLYQLEATEKAGSHRIVLDGPQSLFTATRKYGLRLALMLEPIRACAKWRIEADLMFGKPPERLRFELSGQRGGEPGTEPPLPDEVAELVARFTALGSPWQVERAHDLLGLPGAGLCVPDLLFRHADGTRVHLEVLGFWSREAVWQRIDLVRAGLPEKVLFAVTDRLRVSEEALEGDLPGQLYVYKGVMSPRAVLQRLDGLRTERGTTSASDRLATGPALLPLADPSDVKTTKPRRPRTPAVES